LAFVEFTDVKAPGPVDGVPARVLAAVLDPDPR
jgi:hypothetical protein